MTTRTRNTDTNIHTNYIHRHRIVFHYYSLFLYPLSLCLFLFVAVVVFVVLVFARSGRQSEHVRGRVGRSLGQQHRVRARPRTAATRTAAARRGDSAGTLARLQRTSTRCLLNHTDIVHVVAVGIATVVVVVVVVVVIVAITIVVIDAATAREKRRNARRQSHQLRTGLCRKLNGSFLWQLLLLLLLLFGLRHIVDGLQSVSLKERPHNKGGQPQIRQFLPKEM